MVRHEGAEASSGRYVVISNVATGSSGLVTVAVGGTVIDVEAAASGEPVGPVTAMVIAGFLLRLGLSHSPPVGIVRVPVKGALPLLRLLNDVARREYQGRG